ncbi:MAG: ribonuclease Z, partial [Desulfuromonadales bacterium]|nr:ribonuclease Z [Desulfuromonadales bacterium]NIR33232.1 ribonuclease Z [Desulfuromonadales bacterium]NIS40736.1 ribonuclease Z [Desulfuromonadales bacterium]
ETRHVAIHKDALERFGYATGPWLTEFKDRLRRAPSSEVPITVPYRDGGNETVETAELGRRIAHIEEGMKLCYVTDASPSAANEERIVELAAGAHLLAIEATFSHEEAERARQRNHLTARQAGELARRAGAAKLLVFHHSPRYQDEPDRLQSEAQQAFAGEQAER